jgi:hypothetical protein
MKLPRINSSPGSRGESRILANEFKRHYQDLRSTHRIVLAILKRIDFKNPDERRIAFDEGLWILFEKLLFHLTAAAKELEHRRKELATDNSLLHKCLQAVQDKSTEEVQRDILALQLAAVNNSFPSSRARRTPKDQKTWIPKRDVKAPRTDEGGAKRG